MINLLPDDLKTEYKAARTNVLLTHYMGVIVLAFLFLIFVLGGSYYLLEQTRQSAQLLTETNDTKAEVYRSTKEQVDALSSSLRGAKGILDKEILYSKVLVNIAQLMPDGTILDKIKLDSESFDTNPLSLTIFAKTTANAVSLQTAFKNSKFFKNVSIAEISDTSTTVTGYPVTATLSLTLSRTADQ